MGAGRGKGVIEMGRMKRSGFKVSEGESIEVGRGGVVRKGRKSG